MILLLVGISSPTIDPGMPIRTLGRLWLWLRMKGLYIRGDKTLNFFSSINLNFLNVIMAAFTEKYQVSNVTSSTHLTRYDVMGSKFKIGVANLATLLFHQASLVRPKGWVHFLFLARSVNTLSPTIHNRNIA